MATTLFKLYDLTTTSGKQDKFYDDLNERVSNLLTEAKAQNLNTVHLIFKDESSGGGLTVQQKFDRIGVESVGFLSKVHSVQTMLTSIDPSYVPVTALSLGFTVTPNQDGTVTVSTL